MGIHVSVTILQRLLGFIRVLVLAWMLEPAHMSLWGLGAMLFTVLGPLMTLGSDSGTERYVSLFETRGRLELFYRKMRFGVLALVLVVGAGLLAGAEQITSLVIAAGKGVRGVTWDHQVTICWLALVNAMLWALYLNVLSFLKGMRVYRIVSVVHVFFSASFTIIAIAVLWFTPTAAAALVTHAISLGLSLVVALGFLHFGVLHTRGRRRGTDRRKTPRVGQVDRRAPRPPQSLPRNLLGRLVAFGLISVLGTALWSVNSYISFYMLYMHPQLDKSQAGVFFVFMRLAYPVVLLAHSAWAVLFVHVARRWESGHRAKAMDVLETTYKGVAMAIMTLAVIVYAAAPLWVRLLKSQYHGGAEFVGPLMMSFLSIAFMALMTMIARLRERPAVIAAAAMVSGAANIVLGAAWIGQYGVLGAAYAAGVGMFIGVGLVSIVFLLASRIRLHWSTFGVLALPAVLLLPAWIAVAVWAIAVAVMLTTPLVFNGSQKRTLIAGIGTVGKLTRTRRSAG